MPAAFQVRSHRTNRAVEGDCLPAIQLCHCVGGTPSTLATAVVDEA